MRKNPLNCMAVRIKRRQCQDDGTFLDNLDFRRAWDGHLERAVSRSTRVPDGWGVGGFYHAYSQPTH